MILCCRWVPELLSEEKKKRRLASAVSFLSLFNEERDDFFQVVSSHETRHGQHFCCHQKTFLLGSRLDNDEDVKTTANYWLFSAEFYEEGIQKVVIRYDKYLNRLGNYVEKWEIGRSIRTLEIY
ncbi:hypothetical protein AVEN_150419-1 [Araneus ventricosus]|uniref:Uncharacterized protein n=1 Tax=Araneus ventricosus TaxID=182803 RepID=A0A4Y2UR28_ARAVE|nr:hypothetical protein AVEN_150419-1 [Araneus ventricosus]